MVISDLLFYLLFNIINIVYEHKYNLGLIGYKLVSERTGTFLCSNGYTRVLVLYNIEYILRYQVKLDSGGV